MSTIRRMVAVPITRAKKKSSKLPGLFSVRLVLGEVRSVDSNTFPVGCWASADFLSAAESSVSCFDEAANVVDIGDVLKVAAVGKRGPAAFDTAGGCWFGVLVWRLETRSLRMCVLMPAWPTRGASVTGPWCTWGCDVVDCSADLFGVLIWAAGRVGLDGAGVHGMPCCATYFLSKSRSAFVAVSQRWRNSC